MRCRHTDTVVRTLTEKGARCFVPDQIPSLLFLCCEEGVVQKFEAENLGSAWVYRDKLTRRYSLIPDREMEIFIFVCTAGENGLLYLGDDKPEFHKGALVRVTEGPFKGIVGHVKRIKKDRRVVISISGVAAVATSFIHPDFLETIEKEQ